MERALQPEILDELPAYDRRAIHGRRDLQKVNALMGNAATMARVLDGAFGERPPRSIVELGSGDGTLLLHIAKKLGPRWKSVRVVMVDRQQAPSPRTKEEFAALSWHIDAIQTDVFDWLERPHPEPAELTVTSLFLHHFATENLRRLLGRAAAQTGFFLACEPRRSTFGLGGAWLLPLIGCNSVTWHDARISVRAGFADQELSELWPREDNWRLAEAQAGLFSHCFSAQRMKP